jgi:hypothetical protein
MRLPLNQTNVCTDIISHDAELKSAAGMGPGTSACISNHVFCHKYPLCWNRACGLNNSAPGPGVEERALRETERETERDCPCLLNSPKSQTLACSTRSCSCTLCSATQGPRCLPRIATRLYITPLPLPRDQPELRCAKFTASQCRWPSPAPPVHRRSLTVCESAAHHWPVV